MGAHKYIYIYIHTYIYIYDMHLLFPDVVPSGGGHGCMVWQGDNVDLDLGT